VTRKKNDAAAAKRVRVISAGKQSDVQTSNNMRMSQPRANGSLRQPTSKANAKDRKRPINKLDSDELEARQQRRFERQQQLLAQVAANADRIPRGYNPAVQSSGQFDVEDTARRPLDSVRPGRGTFRVERRDVVASSRQRASPDREQASFRRHDASPPPPRSRSRSNSVHNLSIPIPSSPPIPAVKHRINNPRGTTTTRASDGRRNSHEDDVYDRDMTSRSGVPGNNDFVPFMRTSEVLDPAHAESPLPISREPTVMVKARRAYQHELNPAKYGMPMDHRHNNVQVK
jgi:hypothetical protein